jgi:hypothetical protein
MIGRGPLLTGFPPSAAEDDFFAKRFTPPSREILLKSIVYGRATPFRYGAAGREFPISVDCLSLARANEERGEGRIMI